MSDLHFWASTRYNFDSIKTLIKDNPIIGEGRIRRIIIHRRRPISTGLFFNIHQTHLVRRKTKKIHMIIFDDLDLVHGCSENLAIKIFKNLIAAAKIHQKIFIVCTDFSSRVEFAEDNEAVSRITDFKIALDRLSDDQPEFFCYFDHEDHLNTNKHYDDSPLSEPDNKAAIDIIIDDLEDLQEESRD
jgi:hypothetical protein